MKICTFLSLCVFLISEHVKSQELNEVSNTVVKQITQLNVAHPDIENLQRQTPPYISYIINHNQLNQSDENDELIASSETKRVLKNSIYCNIALHAALPFTAIFSHTTLQAQIINNIFHNIALIISAHNLFSIASNMSEYNFFKDAYKLPFEKYYLSKVYASCVFSLLATAVFLNTNDLIQDSESSNSIVFGIDLIMFSVVFSNSLYLINQRLCPSSFEVGYSFM